MLDKNHPFFAIFKDMMSEAAMNPPVYDLGTNKRFAKEIGLVRELFSPDKYFAGGYNPQFIYGPDSCDLHCDLHDLSSISDGEVGSIVCLSVLEHLRYPERALAEMYRVLRKGGIVVLSVPFFIGFHGKGSIGAGSCHLTYGDYWRPTHQGLELMLREAGFSKVQIRPVDGPLLCLIQIMGFYQIVAKCPIINYMIRHFDRPRLGSITSLHFARAIK